MTSTNMSNCLVWISSLLLIVLVAESTFTAQCRRCICEAEGCDSLVLVCNEEIPMACGPYQITQAYWCDANKIFPSDCDENRRQEWQSCVLEWTCANTTVDAYMLRYGEPCAGPSPTCEHYSKIHKGGPEACQDNFGTPQNFWELVENCCSNPFNEGVCNFPLN